MSQGDWALFPANRFGNVQTGRIIPARLSFESALFAGLIQQGTVVRSGSVAEQAQS